MLQRQKEMEHLTYFKVENFKRFESFEMQDIGQFNLIVGDNNVGKTSVLEALLFDENPERFGLNLATVIYQFWKFKNFTGHHLDYFINSAAKNTKIAFYIEKTKSILVEKDDDNDWHMDTIAVLFEDIDSLIPNYKEKDTLKYIQIPFIAFGLGYNNDLTDFFSKYIQVSKNLRQDVVKALQTLSPHIENIEISTAESSQPILVITQANIDAVMPLAVFGEGTIKLFRILCEIVRNKGKRLMIDEIDAGIHFSRMKMFWKTILKAAKTHEVQLFITTHNEECLRFFKEALEEEEMTDLQDDARCFTLQEAKNGQVIAYKTGFEGFQHAIDQHINIRGGKVNG